MRASVETETLVADVVAKQAAKDTIDNVKSTIRLGVPVHTRNGALFLGGRTVGADIVNRLVAVLPEVEVNETETAKRLRTTANGTDDADFAQFLLSRAQESEDVIVGITALRSQLTEPNPTRRRFTIFPTRRTHLNAQAVDALICALDALRNDASLALYDAKQRFSRPAGFERATESAAVRA